MGINQEFRQKCNYLAEDIRRFNQAAAGYGRKTSGAGCRRAVLCAMPCASYLFLYPLFLISSIFGLKGIWGLLRYVIYLPLALTVLMVIHTTRKGKDEIRNIQKLHLKTFRDKAMGILYPSCVYKYAEEPAILKVLQNVREGEETAGNITDILRSFVEKTILPRGDITYMGQLHCGCGRNKELTLYEVAVDIPARIGRKGWSNEFNGIVGILEGYSSRETECFKRIIESFGKMAVFGTYKGSFVCSIQGLSFDQFMHHRYSASEYSLNNPYTFRPLEQKEMEENYYYICRMIEGVREGKL